MKKTEYLINADCLHSNAETNNNYTLSQSLTLERGVLESLSPPLHDSFVSIFKSLQISVIISSVAVIKSVFKLICLIWHKSTSLVSQFSSCGSIVSGTIFHISQWRKCYGEVTMIKFREEQSSLLRSLTGVSMSLGSWGIWWGPACPGTGPSLG